MMIQALWLYWRAASRAKKKTITRGRTTESKIIPGRSPRRRWFIICIESEMKNASSERVEITITVKMVGLGYTIRWCCGGRVLTVSERLSVS